MVRETISLLSACLALALSGHIDGQLDLLIRCVDNLADIYVHVAARVYRA